MTARRPLRADAAANRVRIVAAAREVYAEQGVGAPFDAIATRAGVANGTLYRHFPNAEALHTAIYSQRLDESQAILAELGNDPDIGAAVERYIEWIAENPDVSLIDIVFDSTPSNPALAQRRAAVRALSDGFFERARAAGVLRDDFEIGDLEVVIYALTQVGVHPRVSAEQRARFTRLVLDGLRAG
jgi:AcrR family transcriptional regulator